MVAFFRSLALASSTALFSTGCYALLTLDIMLRGEDGLALCRKVRASHSPYKRIPVIFLSALGETTDKVVGLEIGGDDYLPKPFETRELVARIKALLRRTENFGQESEAGSAVRSEADTGKNLLVPEQSASSTLRFGEWRLNTAARHLIDPTWLIVPLSAAEYRLLTFFLERPQQVFTRDQLVEHIALQSRSSHALNFHLIQEPPAWADAGLAEQATATLQAILAENNVAPLPEIHARIFMEGDDFQIDAWASQVSGSAPVCSNPLLQLGVRLDGENWLNITQPLYQSAAWLIWIQRLVFLAEFATFAMLVLVLLRRLLKPFQQLTEAADRIGKQPEFCAPLPEEG